MSKGRQKFSFEGLLQKDVLGTFTVIRGFADDLALVSKAIPYRRNGVRVASCIPAQPRRALRPLCLTVLHMSEVLQFTAFLFLVAAIVL